MAEVIYRLPGKEPYSYAEVKVDYEEINGPGGDAVLRDILSAALDGLNATFPNATGTSSDSSSGGAVQSPQGGGSGKSCQHGSMTLKSGTNARGGWSAYFCPERDRAQQCKPIDAKTGKPWG